MNTDEQTGTDATTPQKRPAKRVSLQTVERLSVYRKVLEELDREGVENIHSHELAELVGVTPASFAATSPASAPSATSPVATTSTR